MQQLFSNSNCFFSGIICFGRNISNLSYRREIVMKITKSEFGTTKNGSIINLFHLENTSGAYVEIIDFGCRLTKIVVPAPHVASCAFGGDKLDTLYITTARAGLSEEQLEEYPLSGSVFCCKPGAKGVPANCFH